MGKKIFLKGAIVPRQDTLADWTKENPILEKGEMAIVTDSKGAEWLKLGDGVTPFCDLLYKETGAEVDGIYNPESENAQSGKAVAEALQETKPQRVMFKDGATITAENNTEYCAEGEISTLTVIYPQTDFICSFNFTLAESGNVTITLPESKYIGGTPEFANGQTWELNIKNGVVVGGLVE